MATPSGGVTTLPGQAGWPRAGPHTSSLTANETVAAGDDDVANVAEVGDKTIGGEVDVCSTGTGLGSWNGLLVVVEVVAGEC